MSVRCCEYEYSTYLHTFLCSIRTGTSLLFLSYLSQYILLRHYYMGASYFRHWKQLLRALFGLPVVLGANGYSMFGEKRSYQTSRCTPVSPVYRNPECYECGSKVNTFSQQRKRENIPFRYGCCCCHSITTHPV